MRVSLQEWLYISSLAFSPSDNQPYVAYEDGGYSGPVTVMKFNGTNWVSVGNAGFSAGTACFNLLHSVHQGSHM